MPIRDFEKETAQYDYLVSQIDKHWQDRKKEDFFQKHIHYTIDLATTYIYYCNKLLPLLDEANHL